jgi:hypothetical protein
MRFSSLPCVLHPPIPNNILVKSASYEAHFVNISTLISFPPP